MCTKKIVLLRHGESQWNKENKFTGWCDVDLSENGFEEAKKAGKKLKNEKYFFDIAYTSLLKRAIHTLWCVLDELDLSWIKVEKTWRLNERHYGSLQGLNKKETEKKYGKEIVQQWRRSFYVIPPQLSKDNIFYPAKELKYQKLNKKNIPLSESLKLTYDRVIPFWEKKILPQIKKNKKIIIVAHGNSLRALVKYLEKLNDDEIFKLNIPTGIPIIYTFNKELTAIEKKIL